MMTMMSKRTMMFGGLSVLLLVYFVAGFFGARTNCGLSSAVRSTESAVQFSGHAHGGPCGPAASPMGQPLLVVGLFLSLLATGVSVSSDLRVWREAGGEE